MKWRTGVLLSVVFLLLSFTLPYYQMVQTVDYGSGYYSRISVDRYLLGDRATAWNEWSNQTDTSWSFILSKYYESPYSELAFLHFVAFALATYSLVLTALSLFIQTKRNLNSISARLTLSSILLIWLPALFFDTWSRSPQVTIASVTPSFGFFFSCAAAITLLFSMRSYVPQPSKIRLHRALQRFPPLAVVTTGTRSTRIPMLKMVLCILTLLVGISSINYEMSIWSTNAVAVRGMAYYKMQYRMYEDSPDLYLSVTGSNVTMNILGSVVNPSLCFVQVHDLNMRIYLNSTFFDEFNRQLEQVLEPGGDISLDIAISMSMDSMSSPQRQFLEFINSSSQVFYYIDGIVKTSSFVCSSNVPFSHSSIAFCWKEG